MTPPARYRERLDALRDRNRNTRTRKRELTDAVKLARQVGDDDALAVAEDQLRDVNASLDEASQMENLLLRQAGGVGSGSYRESFLDDPTTVAALEQIANSTLPVGRQMLGPLMSTEDYVDEIRSGQRFAAGGGPGDVSVPDAARTIKPYGIVPQLKRQLKLLDLIPTASFEGGNSFEYIMEAGPYTSAAETAEGAMKPEDVGIDLSQDAMCVARTIAVWKKARRQQLADLPNLAQLLNDRLMYSVNRRLEDAILAGDGIGENLKGITQFSQIGSVPLSGSDTHIATPTISDLILEGITNVRLANAEVDGVVLNPVTWQDMLAAKATGSGERLDSAGAFASEGTTIWGAPVIVSNAIAAGQALVGGWAQGAQLYMRQGPTILISDSDQDSFLRNEITILCELRAGLAVWRPSAFCLVSLS